jgi:hypothetical protein
MIPPISDLGVELSLTEPLMYLWDDNHDDGWYQSDHFGHSQECFWLGLRMVDRVLNRLKILRTG